MSFKLHRITHTEPVDFGSLEKVVSALIFYYFYLKKQYNNNGNGFNGLRDGVLSI